MGYRTGTRGISAATMVYGLSRVVFSLRAFLGGFLMGFFFRGFPLGVLFFLGVFSSGFGFFSLSFHL